MARRIELKPHLTTEELRTRYRACQKPQEKVRRHALYLISKGAVAADAARRTGRASSWITSLVRRYNREGAAAVSRKQSTGPSHRAKVDQKLGKELAQALRTSAPDGGLWTAPKVAAWITAKSGQEVHHSTAWRAMRRLGFSLQVPRPANRRRASLEEQGRVQKKIELEAQALEKAYPSDVVELWSQDEARFGLKPVLRRVWSPKGERPLAEVDERYEWLWLYAATHPQTGRLFWLVWPRLDADCVQAFLSEFAKEHARKGKRLLLVWDGAPAHRATGVHLPERISLLSVPAYTPELNPSERVWPLVKEGIANRAQESLEELEQKVCSRCQKIKAEEVSARTKYHWWPQL